MWLSVSFETDAQQAEALSDALLACGAISVSVEDAAAGTPEEQPQFGEPGADLRPLWSHSRVIALFQPDAQLEEIAHKAAQEIGLAQTPPYSVTEVAEQNWVQLTQSQFEPIRINEQLWIVPSWHTSPDTEAINLVLDPGMAFGTGSHPTTRLCLDWLCRTVTDHDSVLDYGCGSGILAIAAAKLGVREAWGIDIDRQALVAAADNAQRNNTRIELRHSNEKIERRFDILVANILTNPLCVLAPLLSSLVLPQGKLGLSGILKEQTEQVFAAYRSTFDLEVADEQEGWVLITGQRR